MITKVNIVEGTNTKETLTIAADIVIAKNNVLECYTNNTKVSQAYTPGTEVRIINTTNEPQTEKKNETQNRSRTEQ